MSEANVNTSDDSRDLTPPNKNISIVYRYVAAIFSRKFLILIISFAILLVGYYTDFIEGFAGNEGYFVVIAALFIASKAIEAGNPQDDLELIKTMGKSDFIGYKIKLIFGPDFMGMVFAIVAFLIGAIDPSQYAAACGVYMGANSLNKVGDTAAKLANMPVLKKVLGNNNDNE